MKNEHETEQTQVKHYVSPTLREEGNVTERTLGTNPIAPKESVDLMGYDSEEM